MSQIQFNVVTGRSNSSIEKNRSEYMSTLLFVRINLRKLIPISSRKYHSLEKKAKKKTLSKLFVHAKYENATIGLTRFSVAVEIEKV